MYNNGGSWRSTQFHCGTCLWVSNIGNPFHFYPGQARWSKCKWVFVCKIKECKRTSEHKQLWHKFNVHTPFVAKRAHFGSKGKFIYNVLVWTIVALFCGKQWNPSASNLTENGQKQPTKWGHKSNEETNSCHKEVPPLIVNRQTHIHKYTCFSHNSTVYVLERAT